MAKKKTSQKSQQREKVKAKAKQAKAQAPKKAAAKKASKPRIQSPRSQTLPGMEQITNRTLNRICEEVSDCRRTLNQSKQDELTLAAQAADVMVKDNVPSYTHSGVRLTLHAGVTKLSIKLVDEEATAKREAKKAAKAETGSGQDAAETLDANTAEPDDTEADEEAAAADLEG